MVSLSNRFQISVFFDLDGVIIDTERHFKWVDHTFLQRLVPHWSAELQSGIWGMSLDNVFEHLRERHGYRGEREEFMQHYELLAERIFGREVQLFPEVSSVLKQLAVAHKLALCSGAPRRWIEMVLNRFELGDLFQVVVSAEDVGNDPKPSPRIYLDALRRVGASPEQVIAVEDSAKGIASAVAAGIRVVGFRNGMNDEADLNGANWEIRSLLELRGIVASI